MSRWRDLSGESVTFDVVSDVSEATIERQIKSLRKSDGYTIIDLPGGLHPVLAKAIGLSDHVMVPVQGCAMDAVGGAQVLEILKELASQYDIRIPHSIVLTRVSSIITTRALHAVKALLAREQVHFVEAPLIERAAYRDMFNSGGTLSSMDPLRVSNLEKARDNARLFAEEIMRLVPAKPVRAKVSRKKPAALRQAA